MDRHNLTGIEGEDEACLFLSLRGYRLLARNWRSHHHEIDIIADYFGELVFIEVKTRRSEAFRSALDAVDEEKQKNVREAARHYMALNRLDAPFRFDVITIVGEAEPHTIKHYVAAF